MYECEGYIRSMRRCLNFQKQHLLLLLLEQKQLTVKRLLHRKLFCDLKRCFHLALTFFFARLRIFFHIEPFLKKQKYIDGHKVNKSCAAGPHRRISLHAPHNTSSKSQNLRVEFSASVCQVWFDCPLRGYNGVYLQLWPPSWLSPLCSDVWFLIYVLSRFLRRILV